MNQLVTILLILVPFLGLSQKPKTIFMDAQMKVADKSHASFYQVNFVVENAIKHGPSTTFYITTEKYMEGVYLNDLKQGEFKYYFKNGNKWKSENYLEGSLHGEYKEWYENGAKKEVGFTKESAYYIKDYWDSEGTQLISDGSGNFISLYKNDRPKEQGLFTNYEKDGTWLGHYENSDKYYEEHYLNGSLESGTSYDAEGTSYYYYKLVESTDTGILYKAIEKKLSFLTGISSRNIRGEVIVEFELTKEGKINDIEITRSLGIGYDQEVLRALKSLSRKQFEPEKFRGQPRLVKMRIPVTFESD